MKGEGSVRMKTPHARAREAFMRTERKTQKFNPQGGWGVTPIFFLHPKPYFFVSINSLQYFRYIARPLLGEKFVWWWVGGGWWWWWWWLRVNLVLRFGPNLRLRLWIWTWTKLNNCHIRVYLIKTPSLSKHQIKIYLAT